MIHLRSTSIQAFLRCKQEFREHYLMRRLPAHVEIHREAGIAAHLFVQHFWEGGQWQEGLSKALEYMRLVPESQIHSNDRRRWAELIDAMPDMCACYWDSVKHEEGALVETEWSIAAPWNPEIILGGRMDRVHGLEVPTGSGILSQQSIEGLSTTEAREEVMPTHEQAGEGEPATTPSPLTTPLPRIAAEGESHDRNYLSQSSRNRMDLPVPQHPDIQSAKLCGGAQGAGCSSAVRLIDTKTCSEIDGEDAMRKKTGWERAYHDLMVKDFGIALYDWYLRQIGAEPKEITLECIMKPYPRYGKKASVRYVPLPEVMAYRERFDMELEHVTEEIYRYVREFGEMAPWPMNRSACSGKYGNCYLMACCNYGINQRTEKLYRIGEDLGVYEL